MNSERYWHFLGTQVREAESRAATGPLERLLAEADALVDRAPSSSRRRLVDAYLRGRWSDG